MNQDILRNVDGDLDFANGDIVIGQSDQQHVEDIFIAHQGEYKEFPLIGFGAIDYIKSNVVDSEFKRDLKLQLEYDGYNSVTIDISNGIENLKIEI